jgi:beta-galactosidase
MKDQLRKLIMRDRDHPSVIIWSLGNEEWEIQNSKVGKDIAFTLKQVQRQTDSTRLCTYAGNNGDHFDGINSVVDVRGVNYLNIGSDKGVSAPDKYHSEHPDQPIWGSEEASAWSTRGIYTNDTLNGYVSDYDVNAPGYGATAEAWWKYYAARPWLAGAFVWTGFDYRGEPSPYSWPCINSHFGIMDVCGFPKNSYYYYQSRWTDNDVMHLSPHWNWKGKEGQPIDVWCQTNADSVELFLNGKSQGMKRIEPNSHAQWSVPYQPGTLEAHGWRNGRALTAKVETADGPSKLQLVPDRDTINADGEDICIVNLTAFDGQGREAATADNLIKFELQGNAKIIGVGNGNPSSHEPDKYLDGNYQRKLFNGKCQIIIQSTRKDGPILLKAIPDGMDAAGLTIHAVAAQARPHIE